MKINEVKNAIPANAKKLVKDKCCNHVKGHCVVLDKKCMIYDKVNCSYLMKVVVKS